MIYTQSALIQSQTEGWSIPEPSSDAQWELPSQGILWWSAYHAGRLPCCRASPGRRASQRGAQRKTASPALIPTALPRHWQQALKTWSPLKNPFASTIPRANQFPHGFQRGCPSNFYQSTGKMGKGSEKHESSHRGCNPEPVPVTISAH